VSTEQIGLWAGFILTLMVFSYLLGDNFLYRLAVYVFVGLAAAYIAIVTVESVLLPWLDSTILTGELNKIGAGMLPILLAVLLLFKTSSRLGRLGNFAIAFVIGVGAAVALVGALTGTLLPLANTTASAVEDNLLEAVVMFIGVASSLVYFQYLARRKPDGEVRRGRLSLLIGTVGQGFIVVTLGALYAAAILTSLTIFIGRIAFLTERIVGS
jgi:hypothetical protein